MAEPLFSPSWYRVARLKPRLRINAEIHRQQYRGQAWYVLQDHSNGRFQRLRSETYALIGLMNGQRTMHEIWDLVTAKQGDEAPTQPQVVQLLSQLHAADLLHCEISPDTAELLRRYERQQKQKWQKRGMSFFAWQLPLFDPDRLLQWLVGGVRPLFTWAGAVLWVALVLPAILLGATHWTDLTADVMDRVMTGQNLVVLSLLFPIIKALHEFGHAFAVKAFGGEVHDMGVMLLVFTPVPYVDASASWGFDSKWKRAIVGAAGMAVELVLAAVAMFIWVSVEPGMLKIVAYNTILVAGISTVIFNANPLLRFDGYYILSDLIEIPNLRTRANAYLGYLFERHVFGHRDANRPATAPGEPTWFIGFAISSFVYRLVVVVAILLFLADQLFVLGIVFGAFTAGAWIIMPMAKGLAFLFNSPRIRKARTRAISLTAGAVASVLLMLCAVPLPFRTRAEGVVWIPDEAFVRAGINGFVERIVAVPGSPVRKGDPLIVCRDPVLTSRAKLLQGQLREIDARIREQEPEDRVKAQILEEERRYIVESLARAREQMDELIIRSRSNGSFVLPRANDLPERFVHQGELLAHVIDLDKIIVRTVVPQTDIDLIYSGVQHIEVRLAERINQEHHAVIQRLVPAASDDLPSRALGSGGGGEVQLDPRDPEGQKALRKVFQVDLEMPFRQQTLNVGGRVFVRFDHGSEPLAYQWYRQTRQLFLSRFNV
jgi:putative peptide zinc metalloprotease protein